MMTQRRALLGLLMSSMLPVTASAQQDLTITPITPTSGQDTLYSKLANEGPYGYPTSVINFLSASNQQLSVYLPPNIKESRVVVFSHAELLLPQAYEALLNHWASHGYTVVAPLHQDSILLEGLRARTDNQKGETWNVQKFLDNPDAWVARVKACSLVLDALPEIQQKTGIRMDQDRPIIIGHSFGAYAAQLLIGTDVWKADGTKITAQDPRFYGAVLMSPQGKGVLGLREDSWAKVNRPLMVVTGNGDNSFTGQTPNQRLDAYALSPPGNRHLAWFSRISPTLYAGQQALPGTLQQLVFEDLLAVSTAFIKSYADYDAATFQRLAGNYFDGASDNRLDMRYR